MCAPNKTKKGNKLPVSHTLSDHHICHGVRPLGRRVKNGSFSSSSMNCMSMDSITEVFYHLNKMLIATKHITNNNFVFQYAWYAIIMFYPCSFDDHGWFIEYRRFRSIAVSL